MLTYWTTWLRACTGKKGQGLVEYSLIVALIALVCIGALVALGTSVSGKLNTILPSLGD